MNGVFFETVRYNSDGSSVKVPRFLDRREVAAKSLFKGGRRENGLDLRLNAAGDTADSATGYQIVTDTLTYIKKKVSEQKFYEVAPADFIPVDVGDGAFAANILTNQTYSVSDDFESGIVRTASDGARLSQVDVAIASKTLKVANWVKAIGYNIFDLEQAMVANNWDPIEQKHRARLKNFHLGIQKVAFLGVSADATDYPGFINNSVMNVNTTRITALINSLSAANFATFVQGILQDYFTNTNSTALPTHFTIPYSDFLGLTTPVSATYPNVSMLTYLEDSFKRICGPNFKIQANAYCDPTNNSAALGGSGYHVYVLHRYDDESIRMDIPVDYTTTQPGTINNFQFEDVAYAQFTGVGIYRALEALQYRF